MFARVPRISIICAVMLTAAAVVVLAQPPRRPAYNPPWNATTRKTEILVPDLPAFAPARVFVPVKSRDELLKDIIDRRTDAPEMLAESRERDYPAYRGAFWELYESTRDGGEALVMVRDAVHRRNSAVADRSEHAPARRPQAPEPTITVVPAEKQPEFVPAPTPDGTPDELTREETHVEFLELIGKDPRAFRAIIALRRAGITLERQGFKGRVLTLTLFDKEEVERFAALDKAMREWERKLGIVGRKKDADDQPDPSAPPAPPMPGARN